MLLVVPFTKVTGTVEWGGAELSTDGRTLVVFFEGGSGALTPNDACWTGYRPVVEDRGDHVDITLQRLKRWVPVGSFRGSVGCIALGYQRSVEIDLPAPLAGRTVRDPARPERNHPVFDMRRASSFDPLPSGMQMLTEFGGAGGTVERTYLQRVYYLDDGLPEKAPTENAAADARAYANLFISEGDEGFVDQPLASGPAETIEVRGHPADLRSDETWTEIRWNESGRTIVVRWYDMRKDHTAPMKERLRSIAASVRLPG
jgi:hypothetical protein